MDWSGLRQSERKQQREWFSLMGERSGGEVRGHDLWVVSPLWRGRRVGRCRSSAGFRLPAGLWRRITRFDRNTLNILWTNPLKALTQRRDFLCSCCVGRTRCRVTGSIPSHIHWRSKASVTCSSSSINKRSRYWQMTVCPVQSSLLVVLPGLLPR